MAIDISVISLILEEDLVIENISNINNQKNRRYYVKCKRWKRNAEIESTIEILYWSETDLETGSVMDHSDERWGHTNSH